MLSSTRGFVPPDPAGGSASVLVICSRSALAMCHHQQSKILFRIRPVPLTPHLEVPQQPNPLTKTKLSIILPNTNHDPIPNPNPTLPTNPTKP